MRRIVVTLVAALAVVATVRPSAAQKFVPKAIQFKGAPEYTDQELMTAAGLKPGVALSTAEMNDVAKRLMGSGVFDQLAYKFDGEDLVFTMTPASDLYPVRFDNLPLAPGPELDAELHKRCPLYHGKVPAEGGLKDDVLQALEAILASEGVKASVTASPYGDRLHHGKVTAVSFAVAAPPVRIGAVRIHGASAALLPRLHLVVNRVKASPFHAENAAAELEQNVLSFYQDQGFAAARVHAVLSGSPVSAADAILVPIAITVQEGRFYRIKSVRLPPDALVTQQEADRIVNSSTRLTMGEGLRNLLLLLDQRYKSKGYLDVAVSPRPAFNDTAGTVDYTIGIDPGPVYHLAYVRFDNVGDELRSLLMRRWQLMPGDPFDQNYLDTFLMSAEKRDPALQKALADMLARFEISADPATHDVDVIVQLEKR